MKIPYFIFVLLLILSSCSKDDDSITNEDPSNLIIVITVVDEASGSVEVTATADDAVEYEFDFGTDDEIVTSLSGEASYSYDQIGTYEVEVKAYGSSGRFVRASEFVTIGNPNLIVDEGYSTPLEYAGWTRIWNDEFEGTSLDETTWNYEIGTGSNGWGNNELQYYREGNTSVSDGFLVIEALEQSFSGRSYTSSRLTTQNKFSFQYGRVDIRAKLPYGQGIWPALWMLGDNFSSVGWPACGEIDIMEIVGGTEAKNATTHGTIHWSNGGTYASTGGSKTLSEGIFNDEFHVFSIIWDENSIVWYLDDVSFYTVNITPADLSEFHDSFFFIFNVAVGGNWPGSPDETTIFPQKMVVDYIRVFQTN